MRLAARRNSALLPQLPPACIRGKLNVIVAGGTGSGKTMMLNVLSEFIPDDERIIVIEDTSELQISKPNRLRLEARTANSEGIGQVTIRDLVHNALRMRPDRIVIGECRGGETLDMLQAMNTGHEGSLTTAHANTPRDLLSRLEIMVLMSGLNLPVASIQRQIAGAINLIVQVDRLDDGSRRITRITEVEGYSEEVTTLSDIFLFQQDGYDERGFARGRFVATGLRPKFATRLSRQGIELEAGLFEER
ncbi:MAG: CpaF family protein [Candidatus Riflebacteria bacterium]|nr:CpaF family protein [Candidatus Riflebacteria bacterium]